MNTFIVTDEFGKDIGHNCPACGRAHIWNRPPVGKVTYFCKRCGAHVVVQDREVKIDDDPRKVNGCPSCGGNDGK